MAEVLKTKQKKQSKKKENLGLLALDLYSLQICIEDIFLDTLNCYFY